MGSLNSLKEEVIPASIPTLDSSILGEFRGYMRLLRFYTDTIMLIQVQNSASYSSIPKRQGKGESVTS